MSVREYEELIREGCALAEKTLALFKYRGEDATGFADSVEADARAFLAKARSEKSA